MNKPIGIFDSGIGGLTVVKQLRRFLPEEQLIYFGDTARIPYGTRSRKLVQQYAKEDARFLLQFDIKMLVVACNTASSYAIPLLKDMLDIPVVGVVAPGARAAVDITQNRRIGVIGTTATINSEAYVQEINHLMPEARVFGQPCPLLVSLVEEGWINDQVTVLTLQKYLQPLLKEEVDTLILGCTHYPVLEETIRRVIGTGIRLIDSGKETARVVRKVLEEKHLLNRSRGRAEDRFYVSDSPDKFKKVGSRFLGQTLDKVETVDFEAFLVGLNAAQFSE